MTLLLVRMSSAPEDAADRDVAQAQQLPQLFTSLLVSTFSSSILDQYYTQPSGDPNNPPTLKATAKFSGLALIYGDKYYTANLNWGSTNVFFRQIRNFVFDLTNIPGTTKAT